MIALQDVTKTYTLSKDRSIVAVHGLSLEIQRGEFVIITGRSGSGKTTLLNLVGGMTRPTSGQVLLEGTDLWRLSDKEQSLLRNRKLGFVFQFPSLLPSLNALENVVLPTMFGIQNGPDPYERAAQLLGEVGLQDKLASYPRQLSAGQQQRVVIARALMNRPELLLADEPTSDLDEQTEQEIMSLFREIHVKMGVTILLVTHTSQLVFYGTKSLRMANGVFVDDASGSPAGEAVPAEKTIQRK